MLYHSRSIIIDWRGICKDNTSCTKISGYMNCHSTSATKKKAYNSVLLGFRTKREENYLKSKPEFRMSSWLKRIN